MDIKYCRFLSLLRTWIRYSTPSSSGLHNYAESQLDWRRNLRIGDRDKIRAWRLSQSRG
jgi:hypothetical protein